MVSLELSVSWLMVPYVIQGLETTEQIRSSLHGRVPDSLHLSDHAVMISRRTISGVRRIVPPWLQARIMAFNQGSH